MGAAIALLLAAGLPRDPCTDLPATRAVLSEAADRSAGEAEVALARMQTLAGAPLLHRGDERLTTKARVELAMTRLGAFCQYVRRPLVTGSDRAPPETISAILDRPEFAHARDRRRSAAESLLRAVVEWLKALLETPAAAKFGAFSRGVRAAILTGAALLIVLGVLRLRGLRLRAARSQGAVQGGGAPLVLEEPATHLGNARAKLAADPRAAIREGLLALLSALERRRWARPDRVKTNRELALELPRRGAPDEVTRRVDELVRWYDRSFYSLEPVRADEAGAFVEEVERFASRLGGGGAA